MVFGASCYIKKGNTIKFRLDLQFSLKSAAASKIRSIQQFPSLCCIFYWKSIGANSFK